MQYHILCGEIKRFLRDDRPIKASRSIKELSTKMKEIEKDYLNKKGIEISIQMLAEELNTTKEEIAIAMEYNQQVESIYDAAYEDEEGYKIEKIKTGEDEANHIIDQITIKQLMHHLNTTEKELILLRYFKDKTQCQVAKVLGISQVQVSRMEKKILAKMKKKLVTID